MCGLGKALNPLFFTFLVFLNHAYQPNSTTPNLGVPKGILTFDRFDYRPSPFHFSNHLKNSEFMIFECCNMSPQSLQTFDFAPNTRNFVFASFTNSNRARQQIQKTKMGISSILKIPQSNLEVPQPEGL